MRGALLSIILMITAAMMMGCGDIITPCVEDADCSLVPGEGHGPPIDMVCNLDVSPQQRCDEMFGWMEGLPIPIPIPDCDSMSTDPGVCEIPFEF